MPDLYLWEKLSVQAVVSNMESMQECVMQFPFLEKSLYISLNGLFAATSAMAFLRFLGSRGPVKMLKFMFHAALLGLMFESTKAKVNHSMYMNDSLWKFCKGDQYKINQRVAEYKKNQWADLVSRYDQ